MIKFPSRILVAIVVMCAATQAGAQPIPAFSGADGPGSTATGGRGGDVYHVTNLAFDVNGTTPGSFKYGIAHAPAGGRTIVFDVGGTIFQNGGGSNSWFRSGASNITVAGQTAPGGITIAGVGSKFTGNNIILRNITVRTNQDPVNPTSFTYDGIGTQATNSIIDHVSVTWFSDEGISATDAVNNTTVQYALIDEGLNYNGHAFGSIINTQNNDAPIGYHHNLYAQDTTRSPRLGSETGTGAVGNFYNNVVYNWVSKAGYSALNVDSGQQEPSRTNMVNNFYLKGASNGATIFTSAGTQTQIYQNGNVFDSNKDGDFNDGAAVTWSNFSGPVTQLASPLAVDGSYRESATQARDRVLAYGGANWTSRNPIESRIVASVGNGTGTIINTVPTSEWNDVMNQRDSSFGGTGGTGAYARDANYDTDGDGMPDAWEQQVGLNPNVADNNGDFDTDGYTNLEEYLNEASEWPAPQPIVFNGATNNRYAQITNWDIKWQPSKYDEARVNAGTAVVDAVGQHAGILKIATGAADTAQVNITGGWLKAQTSVVIGGTATSQGTLNLSGGVLDTPLLSKGAASTFNFTGGTLHADTVDFSLTNDGGTIAPGHSPGTTQVNGNLVLNSGILEIEIGGTGIGQFDKLNVTGTASLGGTLQVKLVDIGSGVYVPQLGDVFGFLAASGGAGGSFSTLDLPALSPGLAWDLNPGNVTVFLSVVAATLAGDFNGDHVVDAADYTVWRDELGSTTELAADADHNGTVEQADYDIWLAHFGQTSGSGGGFGGNSNVPEPGTIWMAAVAAVTLALSAVRRRRG